MAHHVQLAAPGGRVVPVQHVAIGVGDRGGIVGALGAALDLDGVDAGGGQLVQVLDHAQVVGAHEVRPAAAALQAKLATRRPSLHEAPLPAARLRAVAEGRGTAAARHLGRQQAATRDRHAHGAVREDLELKLRGGAATQLGYLGKRHLAREHHATRAQPQVLLGGRGVHARGLGGDVELHVRRMGARQGHDAQVARDHGIDAHLVQQVQVGGKPIGVGVGRHRVDRHVDAGACRMGACHRGRELVVTEVGGRRAHAPAPARQIHRVGAKVQGHPQLLGSARGCQKLHLVHGQGTLQRGQKGLAALRHVLVGTIEVARVPGV